MDLFLLRHVGTPVQWFSFQPLSFVLNKIRELLGLKDWLLTRVTLRTRCAGDHVRPSQVPLGRGAAWGGGSPQNPGPLPLRGVAAPPRPRPAHPSSASPTHHEDNGDQVGEVGWEPVPPGQLHLVRLQHEPARGQRWGPGQGGACACFRACTRVWAGAARTKGTTHKHGTKPLPGMNEDKHLAPGAFSPRNGVYKGTEGTAV